MPLLPSPNERLLRAASALPRGRGYRFEPAPRDPSDPINPRDPHHDGTSRTLRAGAEVVARAAPDGATYCCGATFEAWWDAGLRPDVDADELRAVLAEWFCPTMGHPGVVSALASRGWGDPVPVDRAIAGDLCQFWRSTDLATPSGHSVLLLGVDGDRLRYWSSQRATEGVGEHEERVGPSWEVHVVRARPAPPRLR